MKNYKQHQKKQPQKYIFSYGSKQRNIHVTRKQQKNIMSDIYFEMLSMNWVQFIGLIAAAYLIINILFGTIYFLSGRTGLTGIHSTDTLTFYTECFFFSVQTFSTIGYGAVAPQSFFTNIVVSVQALFGMLSIGLVSGLFFSRFSRPSAKIFFSDQILITNHLGQRSLVFRLANSRVNTIVNAKVNMTYMFAIKTSEGTSMRQLKDLKLIRNFNSIFFLNWVVAHVIDENSPLYNMTHSELETVSAEILVSFSGTDQTFAQSIHSSKIYETSEIVYDRYFQDMVIRSGHEVSIDLDKISVLV